jgi:peptide/nickel transport system substrate-binding protein
MRKLYWIISIFFRKHGVVILSSIIGAIVIFSVFLPFVIQKINFKPRRYIGLVGQATLESLPREIQEKVSTGLTRFQEDGSVVPSLAERWTVEDDGKTYRFLLRQNVLWQDGKVVEPSDINYNFKGVQVITNQNEIIFKLTDPFSPFPTIVSQPVFRYTTVPYLYFFKRQTIIGTGQYQVTSYQQREGGDRLTQLIIDGPRDQLIYRFYSTEADAISGFKRGEVDELSDLSDPGELGTWPTVEVTEELDRSTYLGVFFNLNDDNFRSKEARLALNYALEKPNDDTRAVSPISPTSWAYADVSKLYDYDKERGIERLLTDNGLPRQPMKFVLTTTLNFIAEAEQIKQAWQKFGEEAYNSCLGNSDIKDKALCENVKIQVEVRVNNFPDTTSFQALLIGQTIPHDPDQYQLWHTGQSSNFTGHSNIRIDSLLERGRQTIDQRRRAEIYSDFQQFFSEDPPLIFLKHLKKYSLKRK